MGETGQSHNSTFAGPEAGEVPRRRSWSKWVFAGLVVFYAATVAGWFYWDHKADRMLRSEVEQVRSAGEPLDWAEFAPAPVPVEQNAAPLYDRAWDSLQRRYRHIEDEIDWEEGKGLELLLDSFAGYPDLRQEHADDLEALLEMSQMSLKLCREARDRPKAYWEADYSRPGLELRLPPLRPYRQLAVLLRVAAVTAHERGRDDEAVAYIRDIIHLSRSVQELPTLIVSLVSSGISETASLTTEEIIAELRVGDSSGAAARTDVLALMEELLDAQALHKSLTRGMVSERSIQYDTCERVLKGEFTTDLGPGQLSTARNLMKVISPVFKVDQALLLRSANVYVRATKAEDYPSAKRILSHSPDYRHIFTGNGLHGVAHPLLYTLHPALGAVFRSHWDTVATRRMAAVALALRLFELDNGRRPESLDELVPEYLSEVPRDPFDPDAHIRYRPDDTPVLYCIGPDGVDDGGMAGLSGRHSYEPPDVLFYLNGDRPRPEPDRQEPASTPSTKPVPASRPRQPDKRPPEGT
ncbi:MAG: hypothetical protein ACP5HU_08530 [Phycisphaerae bacterium]